MENNFFSWIAREEKIPHSKDAEYAIGGIAFIIFLLAVFVKNFFILPIILFGATTIILSSRKHAQCITYEITKKGFSIGEKTFLWEKIKEFNIIDDPGIKGRLIIETESLAGKIVCPIYDDDMEKIEKLMEHYKTKKNEELGLSLLDSASRLF